MKRLLLMTVLLVGCGGPPPEMKPDPMIPDGRGRFELNGPCEDDQRTAVFLVEVQSRYSLVDGSIADGVVPASIPKLVQSTDRCRLLQRQNPFCSPACQAGQTCGLDGTCIAFPSKRDIGPVRIAGLEKEIAMEALAPSNDYFDTDVPHPLFKPNAEIRLSAEGIELEGRGFEPLEIPSPEWVVRRGQDLALTWTPGTVADAEVGFRLNIDQHGASPIHLSCDFEDDGAATVDAELIDALFDSGVSGFPNGALTRRTVDSAPLADGCAEFTVASPQRGEVEVEGHTACTGPGQCPGGQTCDVPNQTCR